MSEATGQDSSEGGRCKTSKSDKTRRSWTLKEEEILLVSLKELVVQGWKADNGFRAGYLNKLEVSMRTAFPGTDLRGMPHINSKISAWKKNHNSLRDALKFSGVGFNLNGTFMLDCNNEQWEMIVQRDNNASRMRFKSWPMFESWKEVFGNDRATGDNAEDVMEAVHKMYQADNLANGGMDGAPTPTSAEDASTDEAEDSVCQVQKEHAAAKTKNKKRKATDENNMMAAVLREIGHETGGRLGDLATRVGYEFDLGMARQTVFDQLGKIPGLDINEKFDICEILADKVQRLEIFIGLPDEAKPHYIARLLQSRRSENRSHPNA
ncbi:uncharacterized protein LOC130996154 [Salvia miltiorrhiza]|uniref:uncharacterized protein LOC130996154 n=1 Tax=Salvia miltiorrhiza TaxID=226208 RepID=UPI0025AC88ED|nr:uncharacterized protein LOC130996154 [Salvia miltiorrhiza]